MDARAESSSSSLLPQEHESLAKAMSSLALSLANLAEGELQAVGNHLELIEKLNAKVSAEYDENADFASGLLVFVERLKQKNDAMNQHLRQIDEIDKELSQMEAVASTLDSYTASLDASLRAAASNDEVS